MFASAAVSAPVSTTGFRNFSKPAPEPTPFAVTVIAPPGATPVQISAPPAVPTPPSEAAFWFLRALRVQVIAVPVFVTDEIDTSVVELGWLAAYSRTTTEPADGVNDPVITEVPVPVTAAGVLTASI